MTAKTVEQAQEAVRQGADYLGSGAMFGSSTKSEAKPMTMEEFSKSVNEFLEFRRYDILKDNGRISHKQAVEKAYQEYDIFNKTQPIESDFDKVIKGLAKTETEQN